MIKDLKDFYVLDIIVPEFIWGNKTNRFEKASVVKNCICRKEISESGEIIYRDLEMGNIFQVLDELGCIRVDKNSIKPLCFYYNFLGIPKINLLEDRENVSDKVKSLRKQKKL